MPSFTERLGEYVRACFTGLWVQTHEPHEAQAELAGLCRRENWQWASWDLEQGFQVAGQPVDQDLRDPLSALRAVNSLATPDGTVLLVLRNFHRFLQSAEIVEAVTRQILLGRQNRTFLVILAPVVQLPVELEKLFAVLEHELPDREQLQSIAQEIATEPSELPDQSELAAVLDAAAGLTRIEAENAFSLSLIRHQRITSAAIWELKQGMLRKSGLLELYQGTEDFQSLGGLEALKAFCKRALLQPSRGNPLKRPRGVLLLSPPGCGKSQFCKCLGREVGRPVLMLDPGNLLGSLVGQSEERTRQALRIVDAMAPCVLMIDEIEKAFAGVHGSGDSGVSARMFGTLLTWLNDHASDVFVVATSNDIAKLPPEFGRSERFDGLFFLDLPAARERQAIWALYRDLFEIDPAQTTPEDEGWTGAEIRACCRLAALLDLPLQQAARNVVPVAVTAQEQIARLQTWASGRCLSANQPGLYRTGTANDPPRRKVRRDVRNN